MSDRVAMGVDLGTSGCKAAFVDEFGRPQIIRSRDGEDVTPSVVAVDDDGSLVVGTAAYRMLFSKPERAVRDFKLKLGSHEPLCVVDGRSFTAKDLAAALLGQIRADAEQALDHPVRTCVLTHPANFMEDQKQDLLDAAVEAGLDVRRLLPEPSAAAIAFGLHRPTVGTVLVFDLGGGTFDVSLAEFDGDEGRILGTAGEPTLGGRDFDRYMMEYVLEGFEKQLGFRPDLNTERVVFADLVERCDAAKRALATRSTTGVTIGSGGKYATVEVSRETFESLTSTLVARAVQTCADLLALKNMEWSAIRQLVLVGGGSLIPGVKEAIERESGLRAVTPVDPLRAVSYGAAMQAAIEIGGQVIDGRAIPAPRMTMKDVTAYDVGCIVDHPELGHRQTVIVPRHSAIPGTYRDSFRLKYPDQTQAEFRFCQGNEGDSPDRCVDLGLLVLDELPPDPSLPKRIQAEIAFDANAMVEARVTDRISGKSRRLTCDGRRLVTRLGSNPN